MTFCHSRGCAQASQMRGEDLEVMHMVGQMVKDGWREDTSNAPEMGLDGV